MGIESATYIQDLDTSLPGATDLRSQGDDHLRLLKTVLKTTFTGATRVYQIPGVLSKTADYTVVKADGEATVYCTTAAGACTFTLPSLVALDAGWKINFIKTNSGANPMFIAPPSGTINSGGISGLAKARRSVPGIRVTVIWDGTAFFVTRALSAPIGSTLEYNVLALPAGYEWPNGQTLASASTNYPEYNSVVGSGLCPDHRGRYAGGKDDMGGSAASRITTAGGVVDGATIGAVGGTQAITLAAANIPSLTSVNASQAISVTSTTNGLKNQQNNAVQSSGFAFGFNAIETPTAFVSTGNNSISVAYTNASPTTVKNLPPTIIVNKILVVE